MKWDFDVSRVGENAALIKFRSGELEGKAIYIANFDFNGDDVVLDFETEIPDPIARNFLNWFVIDMLEKAVAKAETTDQPSQVPL